MRKRHQLFLLGFALIALAGWYISTHYPGGAKVPVNNIGGLPVVSDAKDDEDVLPEKVNLVVAFSAQAPYGEWSDPRQQDGCEETAVAMVKWWVDGKRSVSKDDAKADILALSALSEQMFGTFHDTSATDTNKMLHAWVTGGIKSSVVNITVDVIRKAVAGGRLVIVPSDGRLLGNPNFSGGGPERHIFVIKGYDDNTQQFITNDVGTRKGADYRYSYDTVMNAAIDYATGYHEPLTSGRKVAIVVEKTS